MALRRLQGTVERRSGENGIAVLMQYTRRQFVPHLELKLGY
jgi:hypothetical protein